MPPIVPGTVASILVKTGAERDPERPDGPLLSLVYAGKFAPRWKTLEMTELPARLAERGVKAQLTMIGDKIHTDPADPTYPDRMTAALQTTPGVEWAGPRSRAQTMDLVRRADIGLGWRGGALDGSLELSTKVLEYGAAGLPVVLDRTPMHERLLGADYPLFATDSQDLVDVLAAAATDPAVLAEAAGRCRSTAEAFTMTPSVDRMRSILAREFPSPLRDGPARPPLRVGVAGHDLKFFKRILDRYRSLPDVEVRIDQWPALHRQDVAASRRLAEWADVIVCEWAGPNAVWYSRNLAPGKRLIVRLHRFELYGRWLPDVDIDRVDRLICVSESYAAMTRTLTGWPSSKIAVIPNWVDDVALDRPKHPGAQFHLGFLGMAPARKRLDRALDVLEALRDRDPRFRLFVKSKLPWDYPWVWRWPEERRSTDLVMRRVQTSNLLRGSVVFDDFGPDVGSWLRRIGFVLSTSDDESFHLAPAEGMASRAIPAILDWPGADTIYDRRWIAGSTDELARRIADIVAEDRFATEGEAAHRQAVAAFGLDRIGRIWERLLIEDVELPGSLADVQVPA
jgi:glycosyltransferase involved in cell wall biosynthesis